MNDEEKKQVTSLIAKAAAFGPHDPVSALQFSQASLNAANAVSVMDQLSRTQQYTVAEHLRGLDAESRRIVLDNYFATHCRDCYRYLPLDGRTCPCDMVE